MCPQSCKNPSTPTYWPRLQALTTGRRDQADKWVKALKTMRAEFRIGREPQRIKVAILDTGADANHQDFQGKPIMEYKSFLNGGDARVDPSGHGTHIAGIILDLTSNVELYIAQVTDTRLFVNRDRIVEVSWTFPFILSKILTN